MLSSKQKKMEKRTAKQQEYLKKYRKRIHQGDATVPTYAEYVSGKKISSSWWEKNKPSARLKKG